MIPLLNESSEGIERLKRRTEELGIAWNDTDSKTFGDTMEDIKNAIDGVVLTIGKQLLPILTRWGEEIIVLITKYRELIGVKVGEWIQRFNDYLPTLKGHLKALWTDVSGFAMRIDGLVQSLGGLTASCSRSAAGAR